jgi:hypothetical protein
LVHGGVRFRDAVEVGLEAEDASGLDALLKDVVEELIPSIASSPRSARMSVAPNARASSCR